MQGFFKATDWGVKSATPRLARCGQCGLSKSCFSPRMAPTGRGRRSILYVAEAPGKVEDQRGEQLIGISGKLLRELLNDVGGELDDGTKTNAIICRPPKNIIQDVYVECCRPNLFKTIAAVKPSVIVLLGMSAVRSVIGPSWQNNMGTLNRWLGWTIPSARHGAWLCPTYHPAYLSRMNEDDVLCRIVRRHLHRALELEKQGPPDLPTLSELQDQIEIIKSPRLARLRIRELATRKGVLAFDYEATGLKPEAPGHKIVSCSFCLDGCDTFACRLDNRCLKPLSTVLLNPKLYKVASNIKFEERWTIEILGHGVVSWYWDTMQAAHILDNRSYITGLKFQAFVHFGIEDYDSHIKPYLKADTANGLNNIHKIDMDELLLYNGLDSLIEYNLSVLQRAIFAEAV